VSFILDAIAKSEHDRQQQEVPDARILAIPVASDHRPRRVFPYLVVVGLLLNVIVLVIWMQSDRPLADWFSLSPHDAIERPGEQALAADKSSPGNQITAVDTVDALASAKLAGKLDNSTSKQTTADTSSPQFPLLTKKSESTSQSLPETKSATISEPRATAAGLAGEAGMTPAPRVAATTGAEDTAWVRIEPDTLTKKIQAGELVIRSPGAQDASEVMYHRVSRLSELPADVRRDLPSVDFSGHLYSSNPKVSYVFVNDGRPVFEGQQIVDELFLHKITPSGVIVEFRGYLIDVGVLQNWNLK
jgi:general secretion pathway protein B